jgi:uncharacterized membrane protein YcaP (DUF421 family)
MDTVIHAAGIYLALMILLRMSGRRTLAQATTFDLILLLVISEATQQALLGDDFSITNAAVVIVTLIGLDIGLSYVKALSPRLAALLDGRPMILVEHGKPIAERLARSRVDEEDILEAARQSRGLERMDQIGYAILEVSGGISIIPSEDEVGGRRVRRADGEASA